MGYVFPPKFSQLILEFVTTTSFSVKVNGESCDFFFLRKERFEARQPHLTPAICACYGVFLTDIN